jgi:hypothetical protein
MLKHPLFKNINKNHEKCLFPLLYNSKSKFDYWQSWSYDESSDDEYVLSS